jgi:phosphatidylglycerol---prolipoprotein diacylglyceryl transferase
VKPIPVSFNIWKLKIHTYGIGLAITFWFAFRYFERRLRKHGYPTQWLAGVFVWVIVASILGARAVHVLANLSQYTSDPGQIFAIWNGGLSSFGGLIGGIPTGLILARKRCPQLKTIAALDLVSPVLMAAWGVGRLLGPQLMVAGGGHATSQWFGMYYAGEAGKRLPVPIFQSIESFIIYGILIYIEHRAPKRPNGFILSATMAMWGLSRFCEEHLWLSDTSRVGSFLVQAAGLALCAAGILVMLVLWRRHSHEPETGTVSGATSSTALDADDEQVALAVSGAVSTAASALGSGRTGEGLSDRKPLAGSISSDQEP